MYKMVKCVRGGAGGWSAGGFLFPIDSIQAGRSRNGVKFCFEFEKLFFEIHYGKLIYSFIHYGQSELRYCFIRFNNYTLIELCIIIIIELGIQHRIYYLWNPDQFENYDESVSATTYFSCRGVEFKHSNQSNRWINRWLVIVCI